MSTIVVTGGGGFIGSHLTDRLVADGHDVHVIDSAPRLERATMHVMDIRSHRIPALIEKVHPGVIYHLAAQTSVTASVRDPFTDAGVNIMGTLNLLESAKRLGSHFIFTSTGGAMYGETLLADESHPRPSTPYGASKLAAEGYVGIYGLPWTVLRLGNVYGPRQNPHGEAGVVAIFASAMLEGRRPTMYGDGSDIRDYVYVDDVVEAHVMAARNPRVTGPLNIGTGIPTTTAEIAKVLRRETASPEPLRAARRAGDVRAVTLDCTRAVSELGWTARVGLEEGLTRTVAYLRNLRA